MSKDKAERFYQKSLTLLQEAEHYFIQSCNTRGEMQHATYLQNAMKLYHQAGLTAKAAACWYPEDEKYLEHAQKLSVDFDLHMMKHDPNGTPMEVEGEPDLEEDTNNHLFFKSLN